MMGKQRPQRFLLPNRWEKIKKHLLLLCLELPTSQAVKHAGPGSRRLYPVPALGVVSVGQSGVRADTATPAQIRTTASTEEEESGRQMDRQQTPTRTGSQTRGPHVESALHFWIFLVKPQNSVSNPRARGGK